MFLPKSPWSFPFSTSGSCPKHPIINHMQTWNSLPLHLTVPRSVLGTVLGELESSSHCLLGMDVPSPWCWGTPVALLEDLGGEFSTCLEPLCSFMAVGMGLQWVNGWDGAGMRRGGCNLSSPSYLCASVFFSMCAVKLFIPLLNNCITGMRGKITFSLLMFLFKQAVFKLLKWRWNISSWGNPY